MKRKKGKIPAPPIKLLACPFCENEAGKLSTWKGHKDEPAVFIIDCEACHASGPVMGGNAARAKAAWNLRDGDTETLNAVNRGTPETVYGVESDEEKAEREAAGEQAAKEFGNAALCPFCRSKKIYVEEGFVGKGKKREPYYYTFCGNCEACGPAHDTSEGFAILGWNKRRGP